MRLPTSYTQRRAREDVTMTPMIDVVFLLLVFFVWTASFQAVEYVLPSQISEPARPAGAPADAPPPPEADFQEVVVRILWQDGRCRWLVNSQPVNNLADLRQRIAAIYQIVPEAPLVIHPDQATPLGRVIDVYDLTRQVGFEKVQFAVEEDV